MNLLLAVLLIPLAAGALLALVGSRPAAPAVNLAASAATFAAACALTLQVIVGGPMQMLGGQFFLDPFNVFLVTLTSFVGMTTAMFSRPYMRIEQDRGRLTPARLRLYHSMYQLFMFTMLLALTTNNLGLLWVAMEAATLSTVLLYFAAERVLGSEGMNALLWTHLDAVKTRLEPGIIGIAFVFLLVGYGTKVGLVPLHSWLPDAHAEGPTPVSAVLSGLLLNVALYAVMRGKVLVEGSVHAAWPGQMLMGFGLLSVVFGALLIWRQKDVKRMFAYSSIEHMGIITFAFGMGGPVANFAALLHMTGHALTKSAIFYTTGHAAQKAHSQRIDAINGLREVSPPLGWGLMMGVLAIVGMPPFSVFASEFLILTTAMQQQPWATPILLAGLGVAFGALFLRTQGMVFGSSTLQKLPHSPDLLPVFLHLALVLLLGLWIPPFLVGWWHLAAEMIGA